MDECQEVPGGLVVARGHAAVLLRLGPEPLGQVAVLVAVPVVVPLHGSVLQAGDHRLRPLRLDRRDDRLAVIALVGDDDLRRRALDQGPGLRHVGRLARREGQLDRQPEAADGAVDLRPESAAAAAEGLLALTAGAVPFLGAPAAQGWARMIVESRMSHSRSGSWRASKTRRQVPLRDQRSNRLQAEFQLPNRAGRSRHGAPVLAIQRTASTNSRLSRATLPCRPGRPGSRPSMRAQSSSEMACRCCIVDPPWFRSASAINRYCLSVVHTA